MPRELLGSFPLPVVLATEGWYGLRENAETTSTFYWRGEIVLAACLVAALLALVRRRPR